MKPFVHLMIISRWIFLRMGNVSNKSCRENQNTHFVFNNFFFFFRKSYRLWDNVEKYSTAKEATGDTIIRRMRFVCWIHKATDTHSECVIILIAFPRQQWLLERASMLRLYLHCLSCYNNAIWSISKEVLAAKWFAGFLTTGRFQEWFIVWARAVSGSGHCPVLTVSHVYPSVRFCFTRGHTQYRSTVLPIVFSTHGVGHCWWILPSTMASIICTTAKVKLSLNMSR
jgi:hypothetical protein